MQILKVLSRSFPVKLFGIVAATVIAGTLITAVFFYGYAEKNLGQTYAQRLMNLSDFKQEVVKKSLYIYLFFGALMSASLIVAAIYYSHKVAGPLVRIRIFAKDMMSGKFGGGVKFRSGDVIHPVAEAAEGFSKRYGERRDGLEKITEEMIAAAGELRKSIDADDGQKMQNAVNAISSGSKELDRMLSEIKI